MEAPANNFPLPTWEEFLQINVFWPLIFQVLVAFLFMLARALYSRLHERSDSFQLFICKYIGTQTRPEVEVPVFVATCDVLQILLSLGDVGLWVERTYSRSGNDNTFEVVFAVFFAFDYVLIALQNGFLPSSAWYFKSIVDVFTVVPVIFPKPSKLWSDVPRSVSWVSLRFLRTYRTMSALQKLNATVDLSDVIPDIAIQVFLFCFRLGAMIVCMGGTIFTLEILGEYPGLEDTWVITENGDQLSFIQISYWIVTTISTVGYGDFSPKTAPSRLTIVLFIFAGVVFFGRETSFLLELWTSKQQGRGSYLPRSSNDAHIVIVGSGVARWSSMMKTFLYEIYDTEGTQQVPTIVCLSETPYDEQLREFVRASLPIEAQERVHLLRGSAMSTKDLGRVRLSSCMIVLIIPDFAAPDSFHEDSQNIFRALEIRRRCPGMRLRLVLLEPGAQIRAQQLGISQARCFSALQVKSCLFAQSVRCKGFMTLISGLLQVTSDQEMKSEMADSELEREEWVRQYGIGLQRQIHGFRIKDEFADMPCWKAAAQIYKESSGLVLLVGAQCKGRLKLNFQGDLSRGQIVIAITSSLTQLEPFADTTENWQLLFIKNRDTQEDEDIAYEQNSISSVRKCTRQSESVKSSWRTKRETNSAVFSETGLPAALPVEKVVGRTITLVVLGSDTSTWEQAS